MVLPSGMTHRRAFRALLALFSLGFGANCARHQLIAGSPEPPAPVAAVSSNAVAPDSDREQDRRSDRCFWDDGYFAPAITADKAREHVMRLSSVSDMPSSCADMCSGGTGCGSAAFWQVVRDGMTSVPYLLEALDDLTPTEAKAPHDAGIYTKADVALFALAEIIRGIPLNNLIGLRPSKDCVDCAYWQFVRKTPENRKRLKQELSRWIDLKNSRFVWQIDAPYTSHGCVYHCTHPANGYFRRR